MAHPSVRLAAFLTVLALAWPLSGQEAASGKPDKDYKAASGLENWQYDYDVSSLKPGTYNLLVRATDSAGNVSFSAPFNLIVDPKSDLPLARIANPLPLMRVGADLNVVGTCVDDDAVGFVEIRVDGGEWTRASGSDYWSYYLRTAGLEDGSHVLYARGTDVNGLPGLESSVTFHLDRTKPLHEVASPAFGTLVSGRLSVAGTVYDANGLSSVSYSVDSGATWLPLRHSYDKKTLKASFSLAIDTKKMPDGPAVLWLKSVDGVGSEGVAVFLYFVDNTKPELSVSSPAADEAVNGRFYVSGRAYDTVGVASLSWVYGKETGAVELLPGNPYFRIGFDAPDKAGSATVGFIVTDVTGNVSRVDVTRAVDPAADLPVVSLSYPAAGSVADGVLRAAGGARDDDGVAKVVWKIDDGAETEIATDGPFALSASGLGSGARVLRLRAVDVNGLAGPWLELPFAYRAAAPAVSLSQVVDSSGSRPFAPGAEVSTMDGRAVVQGSLAAANPLVDLGYSINGAAFVKLAAGKDGSFVVPLPPSLPYGVAVIEVKAVDSAGKEGVARAPVHVTNYARARVGPLLDFGLAGDPAAAPAEPVAVNVSDGSPFSGAFVTPFEGEGLRAARLEPATGLVAVAASGSRVDVTRVADGATGPTFVVVETERGHVFKAGPFVFRTDATPPALSVAEPAFGSWAKASVPLRVEASDAQGVASVEYAVNGGPWQALARSGGAYAAVLDASTLSGPVLIDLRAADAAGNLSSSATAVMADAAAPAPERLLPRPGDPAAADALFVVRTGEGASSVASIEVGHNGAWKRLDYAPVLSFTADATAPALVLRVTDKAGNATELDLKAGLAPAARPGVPSPLADLKAVSAAGEGPQVSVAGSDAVGALSWSSSMAADAATLAPAAALRTSGAASLSLTFTGVSPDPKKPVAFWGWAADGAAGVEAASQPLAIKPTKTPGVWTAALKLPAQADGLSSLWLSVRDAAGGDSYARVRLECDSTPPAIEIVAPAGSSPGDFLLAVRASDAHGIASLSYERGAEKGSFDLAPGTGASGPRDGARVFSFAPKSIKETIVIRAVDGSGVSASTTVTVAYDAAGDAPVAAFVTRLDGSLRESDSPLIVHAYDDDTVASVSVTLSGASLPPETLGAEGQGPLFALAPPAASRFGKRAATLSAADAAGLQSAKAQASFERRGPAPTMSVAGLTQAGSPASGLAPGSSIVIDDKTAVELSVAAPNGLARLEYSLAGGAWTTLALPKPSADGSLLVRVPLNAGLPWSRSTLGVRATDAAGLAAELATAFYRVAPAPAAGIQDAEGLYLADARVGSAASGAPEGRVLLAPGESLGLLWNGRPLASVRLEPAVPFMSASFDGSSVTMTAGAEGMAKPALVVATTVDGDVYKSSPLSFVVDAGGPALALSEPTAAVWRRAEFAASGTAADPNGIVSVEWSMDGGASWTAFPAAAPGSVPGAFAGTVAAGVADGPLGLLVRARDAAGRETVVEAGVWKDTAAPSLGFVTPGPADTVNGTVLLSGSVSDAASVAALEFSPDGKAWEPLAFAPRGAALKPGKGEERPAPSVSLDFERLVDLGSLPSGALSMALRARDKSGNASAVTVLAPEAPAFAVDIVADKPVIQVQIPAEREVMRADFVVSGMAFDDDGVKEVFYRLDGADWTRIEGAYAFSVPYRLLDLADNEHTFEAYAVDLNGVKGDLDSLVFRVSREEPVGALVAPDVSVTNRGVITLSGTASDANDIQRVLVSFDNGVSYDAAVGTTAWSYRLDTRLLPDGVHSVYLKLIDGYDTPGFAAGLISVDNTAPLVAIDEPGNGEEFVGTMTLGGRSSDAIVVETLKAEITALGASRPSLVVDLDAGGIWSRVVDLSSLAPGWYNVKVIATDRAANSSYDARNVVVLEAAKADSSEISFPAHGEPVSGRFTLDGRVVAAKAPERVSVLLNGQPFAVAELREGGWWSLPVEPGSVPDGVLSFRADAVMADGAVVSSEARSVSYAREGPWVDIDAVATGDFVIGRPYLTGRAGWEMPAADRADKAAWAEYQRLLKLRRPVRVDVSRDNGKTFEQADGAGAFKFRLETQEYPNGALRLMVRATFADGTTAVCKRVVVLDTVKPEVAILVPGESGRYNGVVSIQGTASDSGGLAEVALVLRSGDKSSYEVPGFIQGSYLDAHLLGATRFEAGAGLSFFDDNVRLQVELGRGFDAQPSWENLFGYATADTPAAELSRFGGYVVGARLLANLAYLPFGYYLGPDWDFFSMSFTLGASFTYFSQTSDLAALFTPEDGKYIVLSGIVGQWEFAKFSFDLPVLKSLGFYFEGGLVFIPSEASTSLDEFIRPNIALGARLGLF